MRVLVSEPIDLHEFLSRFGHKLRGVRGFYIVEPILERNSAVKYGVCGLTSGNAFHRLREYDIIYGRQGDNDCKGVILHYLATTTYNRLVEPQHSAVWKMELHLKRKYKSITEPGRGSERIPKSKLDDLLEELNSHRWPQDTETTLRGGLRQKTMRYRNDRLKRRDDTEPVRTRSQNT
jgi:hypothetical protein